MMSNEEIVEYIRRRVADVTAELASWLVDNVSGPEQDIEIHMLLAEDLGEDSDRANLATAESRRLAFHLHWAASRAAFPDEDDAEDDDLDPDQGYALLAAEDHSGALDLAGRLLARLAETDPDDWNYGNLLHHGHIIRGKVFLARGDVGAASDELLKAAQTTGSPQLDSFGPDLSLAWALLAAGQDHAFSAYARAVSAFWTPRSPD